MASKHPELTPIDADVRCYTAMLNGQQDCQPPNGSPDADAEWEDDLPIKSDGPDPSALRGATQKRAGQKRKREVIESTLAFVDNIGSQDSATTFQVQGQRQVLIQRMGKLPLPPATPPTGQRLRLQLPRRLPRPA